MTEDKKSGFCMNRRNVMKGGVSLLSVSTLSAPGIITSAHASSPIKVGVISPLTGAWTVYGKAHAEGFKLAVEEINTAGGVIGRKIEIIMADSKTEPRIVVEQANRLIREENVDFLAGTFSSAERNAAGPVVAAANKVLLYPTFYEGQEQKYYPGVCNPNIFMFGPVPSQQVWPHLPYMLKNCGKKFFMIGSDYVWPRVTNEVTKKKLVELGGEVVGEVYIPFNTPQYDTVLSQIRKSGANIIFLTLTGSDTINFRKQFVSTGMKKDFTLWTVDDEEVVTSALGPAASAGTYVSFDYFMSIKQQNNTEFLAKLRAKFGKKALMDTVGVAMYNAGHMAAMAIAKTGKVTTDSLREGLAGLTFDKAPQGKTTMRSIDNQAVLPSYLMRVSDHWSGPGDMFQQIQYMPAVVPQTASCAHLPLN